MCLLQNDIDAKSSLIRRFSVYRHNIHFLDQASMVIVYIAAGIVVATAALASLLILLQTWQDCSDNAVYPSGVSVTKHYEEGIIKVEMDGYEIEQRTIQFSNNLFNLVLSLVPLTGDAEGDSGDREAADEEQRRGERN